MKLSEQHIIKPTHKHYKDLLDLLYKSKNLYNAGLYVIRQHYFNKTNKQYDVDIASNIDNLYVNYNNLDKLMKSTNNVDYLALPANTSQEVLKAIDAEFKTFFKSNKLYHEGKLENRPKIPKYKDKVGYFVLTFNKMTISDKYIKQGFIKIPKTDILLRINISKLKNFSQIKIIPRLGYIILEFIYDIQKQNIKPNNGNYMSIDLGINNLATCTSNKISSFIINGKPIKSINQYYNKTVAKYKSELKLKNNKETSKYYHILSLKRKNKIKDYFHKASKYIINQLVENNINTLVIGKNIGWKQEINIGCVNNQKFVSIPYNDFIQMLTYKCQLKGIYVVLQEESYTSKCSFFNNDFIPVYGINDNMYNPSGKRIKRGIYVTDGYIINSDVNGSLNILRKYLNVGYNEIISPVSIGLVMNPVKINF